MKNLNENDVENITNTVASFDELALASKGFMEKLDEIERNLNYKRFYFPGAKIRLYVEGNGEDDENVHYVSSNQSSNWDPRYLVEYINKAKNDGYERHVIYYNPFNDFWESKDYGEIEQIIKEYFDPIDEQLKNASSLTVVEETNYSNAISSAVASLEYFDKIDDFIQYSDIKYIPKLQSKYKSRISYYKNLIKKDLTNKTADEFKLLDYGYFAPKSLAFDAEDELAEYNKYEKDYEEYKEKLWEILKNVSNLQLCASNISGIQQASGSSNITINQYVSCINEAREQINNDELVEVVEEDEEEIIIPKDILIDTEMEINKENKVKIINIIIIISTLVILLSIVVIFAIHYFRASNKILQS